ncbi:efflux RND transporter periplasmic adaptor subunit [Shewanella canadensis]|uniref:Efflux RND transporter periplasmic adaptor subunit n=1 Tax=Shewanella canadensis TaxID=271096 RepID=A0A3S0S0R7_9GAMM|nr:efflux RND transporter periplasmic adaptor subunit [Shewanella canadensis]RTR40979.1 efflux RND transporter periplasmic adaptor subunit [Shewanella canadensis]
MFKTIKKPAYTALLFIFLSACGSEVETPVVNEPAKITQVQVQTLKQQTFQQNIRAFGVLEAAESVTLSTEFTSKVRKVEFKEGQQVVAGQQMLALDIEQLQMHVNQAQAQLQTASIKLKEAKFLSQRREELFTQKLVSVETVETFRSALEAAQAQFESATVSLNLAKSSLSRAHIVSPVSGLVIAKNVEVGEILVAGSPFVTIQVTDTMRVLTYVTEQEINAIQIGAQSIVTTPGVRGREYLAHIESKGGEADSMTGNFAVKLTVGNNDGLLKAGMTAITTMQGLSVGDALLLPQSAVVDRNRKHVAFKVVDNKAVLVEPVIAASLSEGGLPILDGFEVGDRVIISGLDNVVDGKTVKAVEISELMSSDELPSSPDKAVEVQPGSDN